MTNIAVPVLALSGSVGVGKSSVLIEMHYILAGREMAHACVELDALGYSWPSRGYFNEETALANLASVWENFRAAGAERIVVAGVLERARDVERYARAITGAHVTVCRLVAPESTRLARLRERERGAGLDWHLARTIELDAILDRARIEDFVVDNGDRPLREVALDVLIRARWLDAT